MIAETRKSDAGLPLLRLDVKTYFLRNKATDSPRLIRWLTLFFTAAFAVIISGYHRKGEQKRAALFLLQIPDCGAAISSMRKGSVQVLPDLVTLATFTC